MLAASETHDLLWASVLTGGLAFVGMLVTSIFAVLNHRQGRRIDEQVRPANGSRLAQLVDQISRTGDATDGRVHDISRRVDSVERKVGAVETKLDEHMSETAPLVTKFKEMLKEKED